MAHSTIALIILAAMVILFATEALPLSVTSLLAALAMGLTGIVSYTEVFSGFTNVAVLLIIGMSVIGECFFSTGISSDIGKKLVDLCQNDERKLIIALYIFGGITSAFFNSMIVMAVMMPIIDCVAEESGGKITRRHTYLPLAISTIFGSNLTVIGSTSMLAASALAQESVLGYGMNFFSPAVFGLPGYLIGLILYILPVGYNLQKKWLDFIELPPAIIGKTQEKKAKHQKPWRKMLVIVVTVGCIGCFIAGLNMAVVALIGACILIAARCIDAPVAWGSVSWGTVIIIVGTLGFAKGLQASGAGELVSHAVISICGPLAQSPAAMCIIILLIATVLSNFMSNNAAVAILVPLAIPIAMNLGANALYYVIAVAVGANISVATPVSVATITVTTSVGYRFKDYLRVGGLQNLAAFAATAVAVALAFGF